MERRKRFFSLLMLLAFMALVVVGLWLLSRSDLLKNGLQKAEKNQPGLYSIDHFIDGDTIAVNMNGVIETIRMIGIDTPETHKPNTPVQCYGEKAAAYTRALIGGNKVRLQADSLDTNRDRYGRLLRYVYLPDSTLVEAQLIQNGYAFAYTQFPFTKTDEFVAYEHAAKQNNKGLWAECQVLVESNGRKQTNAAN
jgi:endonuclease YncB( thermonuclease family)